MVTTVTDNSPQSINTSLFSLDKEVQEVKKTTNEINDKLAGINTESGVISVNGKQGIVELNASDVNALPDTTVIPTTTSELTNDSGFITINDVGDSFVPITRKVNNKQLNTDITLTASDVGALPDTTVIPTTTSQLTNDSGFITSSDSITGNAATATKATQDGSGNVITDTYLPLSGGAMTGNISYQGSKSTHSMIKFIDNKSDVWGNGIAIGGGGATIIGGGESSDVVAEQQSSGGDEKMIVANDGAIDFYTNCQDGFASAKHITMNTDGTITAAGFNGKASTAGTADTATKAIQDGNGNVITSTYAKKGEVGVPQVVHFGTSNSAGSYELVHFGFRSAFRCVISGTCSNYAEAKIIDVIASNAGVPQSNTLGNTAIGSQGNFSFGGGDSWVSSHMYWNKPLTEENVYYTVVLIPYSESNIDLVI